MQALKRTGQLCASSETDWPAFAKREVCADMLEGLGGISQPDREDSLAMQEWLRQQCGGSAFDKGCFQDLRQQLARLAVQMCDCWSQVHVVGDTETRWRLLYQLLYEEVPPSATFAASVETCCGCGISGSLRRDADAGDFREEGVDSDESSDPREESLSVNS